MGYVYVIENGRGFYKIGQTNGPVEKRLSMLQIGSPDQLVITHVQSHSNPSVRERELHQMFSSKRTRGEWFELSPEDLATITNDSPMCWERLVQLEPRLGEWLTIARDRWRDKTRSEKNFCSIAAWYGFREEEQYQIRLPVSRELAFGLKKVVCELVGWDAKHRGEHPDLTTYLAYDIAYETLFEALPPCHGFCGCVA